MKISDLIRQLERVRAERGDLDVVAAHETSYLCAAAVVGVAVVEEAPGVAWIAVGTTLPGPSPDALRAVFEAVEP